MPTGGVAGKLRGCARLLGSSMIAGTVQTFDTPVLPLPMPAGMLDGMSKVTVRTD